MVENLAPSLRLLLVTDDRLLARPDPVGTCLAAVAGGVTAIQLRLKQATDREYLDLARQLRRAVTIPLYINDRLDIALAAGADGVHLGVDDIPPLAARRIVPPGFVIGASVGADEEVERGLSADYWGVGPLRATTTKADAGGALGWAGARALLARAGSRPCVVIGGVQPDDVDAARTEGFAGVAVASGILGAGDVVAAARRYAEGSTVDSRQR